MIASARVGRRGEGGRGGGVNQKINVDSLFPRFASSQNSSENTSPYGIFTEIILTKFYTTLVKDW